MTALHRRQSCSDDSGDRVGPFRLQPAQRTLLENDRPVRLGMPAMEILIALADRAGELISKEELATRVWPKLLSRKCTSGFTLQRFARRWATVRRGSRYIVTV